MSSFMEENLRAKFYNQILEATQKEFENVKEVDFVIDKNIENPSNKDVIDCSIFFKEISKKTKKTSKEQKDFKSNESNIQKISVNR